MKKEAMLQAPMNNLKSQPSSKTVQHLEQPLSGWMLRTAQPLQQRDSLSALQKMYGNQAVLRMKGESAARTRAGQFTQQSAVSLIQRQSKPEPAQRAKSGDREEKQTKTSSLPTPQLPTCDLKEVDQWIRDPQNPNVQLFGLTELSGAGGTQPMFKTAPAPIGNGVVILPTTTAIPPIRSQFLKAGRYLDTLSKIVIQPGGMNPPGSYPVVWDILSDGANQIKAGEQEHCTDYQLAFYISLYRFAEIVNDLARSGVVYSNEAQARAELEKQVKIDPANLPAYFQCLARWMLSKRDTEKWHTSPSPKADRASIEYDSKAGTQVAVFRLTAKSLPEVGKHPSWDLLYEAASTSACLKLTKLKL